MSELAYEHDTSDEILRRYRDTIVSANTSLSPTTPFKMIGIASANLSTGFIATDAGIWEPCIVPLAQLSRPQIVYGCVNVGSGSVTATYNPTRQYSRSVSSDLLKIHPHDFIGGPLQEIYNGPLFWWNLFNRNYPTSFAEALELLEEEGSEQHSIALNHRYALVKYKF